MSQNRKQIKWLTSLLGAAAIFGGAAMFAGADPGAKPAHDPREYAGGDGTAFNQTKNAFALPMSNLPTEDLRKFTFGNRVFNTNWVQAGASVQTLDGLGPVFNRVSCSACHLRDGRGQPPAGPEQRMDSMLMRLSVPGTDEHGGPKGHEVYGGQLNDRAILGVEPEGWVSVSYTEKTVKLPDGEVHSLRVPRYEFRDLAFGPLGKEVMTSPRVAPAVYGLGLLEAIEEKTLRGWADEKDADGDGISGRVNQVWDQIKGRTSVGRFGWKANQPSLRQQNAGAALGDIGITTSLNPVDNIGAGQVAAAKAADVHSGGSQSTGGTGGSHPRPEMSDEFLDRLTFYTQTLAVPARRNVASPVIARGESLFTAINCASCHKPRVTTGEHPIPQLSRQTIQPYTDLLLHDMGPELADGRPDYLATGQEWRTSPLWGIGLTPMVNGHSTLLHDGRARNVMEAILWHGGESEKSRKLFEALPKADRQAVIQFVESL